MMATGVMYLHSQPIHSLRMSYVQSMTGNLTSRSWLNLDTEPVKTREATVSCLHQAIVECLVRQKAGLNSRHASEVKFTDTNRDAFASAEIIMSKTGQPMSVKFASEEQRQDVIDTLVAANKTATNNQEQETIEMETHTKDVDIESNFRDVEEKPIPSLPVRNNALQYVVRDQSFLDLRLDAKKPVTFAVSLAAGFFGYITDRISYRSSSASPIYLVGVFLIQLSIPFYHRISHCQLS